MAITDSDMDEVAEAWASHAAGRPDEIQPRALLQGRDLRMYTALGKERADELSRCLVEHRSIAGLEISMGSLYERLLQELGTDRVAAGQRSQPGYTGIDFLRWTDDALELISFKSGLTSFSGDLGGRAVRQLLAARDYWVAQSAGADANQFGRSQRVVMVRAVARGPRKRVERPDGILWLVGDAMWEHVGADEHFLSRVSAALARRPLDTDGFDAAKERAAGRVLAYLNRAGLVQPDGTVDWLQLSEVYN